MKQWFIQIEDKNHNFKFTIYENGKVYGKKQGDIIGVLNNDTITKLKSIINENIYMFKSFIYYKENLNPYILRINDTSRKHRNIKIVGWSQMPRIMRLLRNEHNFE